MWVVHSVSFEKNKWKWILSAKYVSVSVCSNHHSSEMNDQSHFTVLHVSPTLAMLFCFRTTVVNVLQHQLQHIHTHTVTINHVLVECRGYDLHFLVCVVLFNIHFSKADWLLQTHSSDGNPGTQKNRDWTNTREAHYSSELDFNNYLSLARSGQVTFVGYNYVCPRKSVDRRVVIIQTQQTVKYWFSESEHRTQ